MSTVDQLTTHGRLGCSRRLRHSSVYQYHFESVELFSSQTEKQVCSGVRSRRAGFRNNKHPNLDRSCFSPALTEIQDSVLYCHSNAVWNLSWPLPLPRKHTPGGKTSKPITRGITPATLRNPTSSHDEQHD